MLLMLLSFVLLAAAYIPSRIRTAAKHPMLAGGEAVGAGHLMINGDLASMVLFGSFLAYAVYDLISVKNRPRWGRSVRRPAGLAATSPWSRSASGLRGDAAVGPCAADRRAAHRRLDLMRPLQQAG